MNQSLSSGASTRVHGGSETHLDLRRWLEFDEMHEMSGGETSGVWVLMDMTDRGLAYPKPEPLKRTKGRNDRIEAKVAQAVRAVVAERDGDCRLHGVPGFGVCGGESEWAHLEDKRRARTRGMDPAIRHTPQDSACLCTVHHKRYDAFEIAVEFLTPERAAGRMTWHTDETRYTEPKAPLETR